MNDRAQAEDSDDDFVGQYLPALLAQASHLISSEFHRVVKAHGMTVSEWRVLSTLARGDALTTTHLAQISLIKGPTATRLLDRIEERGLVERLSDTSDRRLTRIRITPAGKKTVSRLIALARDHERRVLEPFGLADGARLKTTLRRLIELHRPGEGADSDDTPED